MNEVEKANEEWKRFLAEVKEQEMQRLTWGVPLKSRNSKDVIEALSRIHTRYVQSYAGADLPTSQ